MIALWIALSVLVVGVVGGVTFAFLRGRSAWRELKRTSGAISAELDRVSEASAQIERHLAAAGASQSRLTEARKRFAASKARLDVQLAAIREARRTIDRVLWFLPGHGR